MIRLRKIICQLVVERLDDDGNTVEEGPLTRNGSVYTVDVFPHQLDGLKDRIEGIVGEAEIAEV